MENVSGDMLLTTGVNGTAAMTEAPGRGSAQDTTVMTLLAQYLPYLPRLAEMRVVTDTGALVGQLAPQMDRQLGLLSDRQRRL